MKTNTISNLCMSLLLLFVTTNLAQAQTLVLNSAESANLLSNGGFESGVPSYWTPSGSGAEWSKEQYRTADYSLKLSGSGEASWTQNEAVRNWVPGIPASGTPEIIIGGWVYTDGVNTAPASDAEKFQLVYEFFDAQGNDILGAPVAIDVPQETASSNGWVEINSTSLGAITLPSEQAAKSVKITFRKGANATGTVYLEDIFIRAAEGAEGWPGGWFNPNMDMADTWYYWYPGGFDQGSPDWPDSSDFVVTLSDEQAHSGSHSIRIEQLDPTASEAVAISERVPVTPGEPLLVSFWVKYEGVAHPDSIGKGDNNIGMTALWYNNLEGGAAGWGEIGGLDIRLNGDYNPNVIPLAERTEASGWTQYAFVVYPKDEAVGMELRLRYWHAFEGITFWDDVSIINLGDVFVETSVEEEFDNNSGENPKEFQLFQNYPNPFNPSTKIAFKLDQAETINLNVYNILGQKVMAILSDAKLGSGLHTFEFDASNLPSGIYIYELSTSNHTEIRKMTLIK